ncbi:MAG: glycosyl transferase, group 1 [Pedosphaera sp.]|nr:glycosyl transferase, group 1 [Pedosphaera sp.]
MKIGILATDFINWGGGIDFLRMVIDSLLVAERSENTEFHLLIPDFGPRLAWRKFRRQTKRNVRSFFSGKRVAEENTPESAIIAHAFSEFQGRIRIQHIDIGRGALSRAAKRLKLDVVLPAVHSLGVGFPRPWVAYAYDFQHKYLPQHFTPDSCRSRDEHFADLLTQARAVIVNSRAAAEDIAKFVPQGTARVFALPFAPAPNPDWLEDGPDILPRYGVAAPFFIISNQFWAHKDHATAFEAFRLVAAENAQVTLVCTGSTLGSRDPEHVPQLLARLKSWGLEQRVSILGLIPKRDQIELMKNACAVIQPTLFEGGPGGGAVYDAVSLGLPAIISDIAVNREITDRGIVFFPAGDAMALAGHMKAALAAPRNRASASELVAMGKRRRVECGEWLWRAIDAVV